DPQGAARGSGRDDPLLPDAGRGVPADRSAIRQYPQGRGGRPKGGLAFHKVRARVSGRDYGTVTALPRRQVPHATGRRMPIGTSTSSPPLPHSESLHALDWLNFFLAALLMGFGPFVAVKLADRAWMPATIGLVLTTSGIAGLLTQVPAGELIDISRSKRILV